VQPEWQGREIQCPTCSQAFVLAAAPSHVPASTRGRAAPPPTFEESDIPEFTPDDPAETPADAFADVGGEFEVVDESAPPDSSADWNEPPPVTTLEPASGKKKKKKAKSGGNFLEATLNSGLRMFLCGGGVVLLLVILGIAIAPLGKGMIFVGLLLAAGGGLYGLKLAFGESAVCGLLYFFEPTGIYRLYYIVTRWSEMKNSFFAQLFGAMLCIPSVVIAVGEAVKQVQQEMNAGQWNDPGMQQLPQNFGQPFGDPNNPPPGVQQPGNQPQNPAVPAGQPQVPGGNPISGQGQPPPNP
jgi:hypothetical protein